MSAFGTSTPCYAPPGGLSKPWALPAPAFATWQGVQATPTANPCPNHRALGRLQPVKAKPLRGCFASLDGFPAPSASDRFAIPRRWKGVKGDVVVHFTLDALESTQHSAQGNVDRFCHMPLRPSQVSVGFGAKPQGL